MATTRRYFLERRSAQHRCSLSTLLQWLELEAPAALNADDVFFGVRRTLAGQPLVLEGAPFENLFFVSAGSFKLVRVDEDGYEQVVGFAVPGDVIGLDGIAPGAHAATAVALEDSNAIVLPFEEVRALDAVLPQANGLLHHWASRELVRGIDTLLLVSPASAEVRLARFLLLMSRRSAELNQSSRRLVLRMSRRDIANHLCLANETISRSFSALAQAGYLRVSQRDVEILDASGLQAFQRSTRRAAGDDPDARIARGARAAANAKRFGALSLGAA